MNEKQEKKLNDIHAALVGNPEYKQIGLIERVQKIETAQHKAKMKQIRQTGFFTGVGLVLAEIGRYLFK